MVIGGTDEVQLSAEQGGQRGVALQPLRPIAGQDEMDLQSEPSTGGRGHPAVVRLRRTDGDERASAGRHSLGTQELQFARLVASGAEAGEVIALHPQARTAGKLRPAFERSRQRREGHSRDMNQLIGDGAHCSMLARSRAACADAGRLRRQYVAWPGNARKEGVAGKTDWNPVLRAEFAKPYWSEPADLRTRRARAPPRLPAAG